MKEKIKRFMALFAFVVVIDAGHGGVDNGATSAGGLKEKDVSLNIAVSLKERLIKENDMVVVLTRDSDINVTSEQRAVIANQAKANLFVSLHANYSPSKEKSGIEFFYYKKPDSQKTSFSIPIPWNGVQLKYIKPSKNFAGNMINAFVIDEQLRQLVAIEPYSAPLLLLKWLAMPAVHVELGYLSNSNDEQMLLEKKDNIVEAIAKGILSSQKK